MKTITRRYLAVIGVKYKLSLMLNQIKSFIVKSILNKLNQDFLSFHLWNRLINNLTFKTWVITNFYFPLFWIRKLLHTFSFKTLSSSSVRHNKGLQCWIINNSFTLTNHSERISHWQYAVDLILFLQQLFAFVNFDN